MKDEYSGWLIEGYFIKLYDPASQTEGFYTVAQREVASYEHVWSETIARGVESGPESLENLKPLDINRIYQTIFGVDVDVLVYVDFPQGTRRWGTDKQPKASSSNRNIGWIDNKTSPYHDPSFETEIFLQKGGSYEYPFLYAYNPGYKTKKPKLLFIQNRLAIEAVTEEETIAKLEAKTIPYRFVTMGGLPASRAGRGS